MLKKILATALITLLSFGYLYAKGANPPFLIMDKIPHLTGLVKVFWDDKELKLTQTQQTKLLKIRKDTLSEVGKVKKSLAPLEDEVATKIQAGAKPDSFTKTLNSIAALKIKATQAHLRCFYKTKKVLTKEQLAFLLE